MRGMRVAVIQQQTEREAAGKPQQTGREDEGKTAADEGDGGCGETATDGTETAAKNDGMAPSRP